MSGGQDAFRLAIRQEGPIIKAYFAPMGTMDGAIVIGSIATRLCAVDRAVFDSFAATMTLAMTAMAKDALGVDVTDVRVQSAPEHEKAGHA